MAIIFWYKYQKTYVDKSLNRVNVGALKCLLFIKSSSKQKGDCDPEGGIANLAWDFN